jgi:hypothetical protein
MTIDSDSGLTIQHQDRWPTLLAAFDSTTTKAHVHQHKSLIDGYLLALLDGGLIHKFNYERLTKAAEDCAKAAEQAALQDY